MTFISTQYVPSICPEPAARKLREQLVSAGTLHFSSVFYNQGIKLFKIKCGTLFVLATAKAKLIVVLVLYYQSLVFIRPQSRNKQYTVLDPVLYTSF